MKECMNCGGPVADDDTHCTTCGLERGLVIYGERPGGDDRSGAASDPSCAICGGPLDRDGDDDDDIVLDDEIDENADICLECEQEMQESPEG